MATSAHRGTGVAEPTSRRRPAGLAAAATLGAGLGCVAYGTVIERRWYRVRRLVLAGALRRPGRLTVLHLSDIHLLPGQTHRTELLAALADEDHDLVVVTGDLLGAPAMEDAAVAALAPLTGPDRPGLVVLGSNDLYGPVLKSPFSYFTRPERRTHGVRLDTDRLVAGLAAHGYLTLRNAAARVSTRAGVVAVGGIDDPHLDTTVLPSPTTVFPAARSESGADAEVLRLGLVHAPYTAALDVLVAAGHDVLLAGHTHGGQVRLPGIGALVGNCDLPLDQVRGPSRYGDAWLHVSPGLGHSRYAPFRFACRPEATLLTLVA